MATIALQPRKLSRTRRKLDAAISGSLLVLGFYFPTSIGEQFSTALLGISYLLSLALLFLLFLEAEDRPSFLVCVSLLSIVPLLLVFTYTSGLHTYTFGALGGFAVLSALLITNLREVRFPPYLFHLCILVNILNILV